MATIGLDKLFYAPITEDENEVTLEQSSETETKDFKVTYDENIDAGRATVTITGEGNYSGTIERTFEIKAKKVNVVWTNTSLVFNRTYQKPTATAESGVSGEQIKLEVSGEQMHIKYITDNNNTSSQKVNSNNPLEGLGIDINIID